ncbi:nonsense-mediated mRNA decay factor SMG8 isoform X2 [Lycorma delicatula]|uniref:nonsense-mediated mRNA decay factor SMG8 isoform X2 n=1 Tax=Lycorma delicatula TaxID=130591 RepID=UPI003F516816
MKPKKFILPLDLYKNELSTVLNKKAVIVSFIGKSSYNASSYKMGIVDTYLGQQIFKMSVLDEPSVDSETMCSIEGYYDSSNQVIYLHLLGVYDTYILVKHCYELSVELEEKGFLSVWTELKHKYSKALLFLFSISHILVLMHPSQGFDVSYIQLFRSLDAIRLKLQSAVGDIVSKVSGTGQDWVYTGRLCPPRVLFYFQRAPAVFKKKNTSGIGDSKTVNVKKLEHSLEDQIYHVLRKSRVVTNVCANSLFAIPANQEFVYVEIENKIIEDWQAYLLNSMVDLCRHPNSNTDQNHNSFGFEYFSASEREGDSEHSFKNFLKQHIDQALNKGFDDNVGRHTTSSSHFVIPNVGTWFEVANNLFKFYFDGDDSDNYEQAIGSLYSLLDTDVRFSKGRCNKVLPLATATYQENLPAHYTREYHQGKVAHALSVFGVHARGPLVDSYVTQLEKECEKHWKNGRQMCEVLSLTGNPCTNPLHRGGSGDGSNHDADNRSDLPTMEHSSGVRYISACDCGHKQGSRDDPFTVKAANYDFYKILSVDCGCDRLDRINFPVFQPSTKDYKAAQLFSSSGSSSRKECISHVLKDTGTQQGNTQGLSLAYVSGQSGCVGSDLMLDSGLQPANAGHPQRHSQTSPTDTGQHIVIQVSDMDPDFSKEKGLVRQPSTTEYLPGMLHTESPGTLLPQFPSWSLVCLGPSSLYSHNLGLQEQHHAGLLGGSAYLLPWDVTVRLEQHQKDRCWPAVGDRMKSNQPAGLSKGRKSKGTKDLSEFSVKIFVGVEYECPRGHRFMCSGPDKVLKTSGGGLVKDNGNKVTGCDMPLYFPCPCRATKPLIAQLMRVHVVTPKAPVHVTLNPRVQPAPSPCPIFVTGCSEPVKLSQSAYWVLRLPYVYVGEQGVYLPPKEPVPQNYGQLLSGMYGISEITDGKY